MLANGNQNGSGDGESIEPETGSKIPVGRKTFIRWVDPVRALKVVGVIMERVMD
ncbi:MAG: hypothetical protein ABSE07_04210 [Methanoregula sp.]|jgi:hypothetical protein